MKQAYITVEVPPFLNVRDAVCYEEDEEEAKIMGFIRDRIREGIKANYRGWKAALMLMGLPRGVPLMREIVKRAEAEFGYDDILPQSWPAFRAWAIRRGFLAIKELEVPNVPC